MEYIVHLEHWQRHMDTPADATFIEHVEVFVEAPSGDAAARAAKAALGQEWTLRVVSAVQQ
jgi:hypothetical protein